MRYILFLLASFFVFSCGEEEVLFNDIPVTELRLTPGLGAVP